MRVAELSNYRQFAVGGNNALIRLCWSCSTGRWTVTQWAREKQEKGSGLSSTAAGVSVPEHMPVLPCSGIIYMTFPMGVWFPIAHLPDERWWCSFQLIQFLWVNNHHVFSQNSFSCAYSIWGFREVLIRPHLAQLHGHAGSYSKALQESIQKLLLTQLKEMQPKVAVLQGVWLYMINYLDPVFTLPFSFIPVQGL